MGKLEKVDKKRTKKEKKLPNSLSALLGTQEEWGDAVSVVVPSGAKLIMEDDSDCILCYIGEKDISSLVPDKDGKPQAEGSVIYQTFYDGKRFVSMPNSHQISKAKFVPFSFYYIHCVDMVNTNPQFNDMKDFNIRLLKGKEGDIVKCSKSRTGQDKMKLSLEELARLNYNYLNYPLRDTEE